MSQQSTLLWTLASMAAASAFVVYRLLQRPDSGGVEEIGEAEHELDALLDRGRAEPQAAGHAPAEGAALAHGHVPAAAQDAGAAWDNDDRARRALEERQAAQAAQEPERVNAWKQRGEVGTKKAKSLAKRDQRRAYYEYVRQQAEQRKEEVKLYEEAFGDLIAKEREERQRKIDAAKAELEEYNNSRRQMEEEDRTDRRERRERIARELQTSGLARLDDDDGGLEVEIAESITGAIVLENEQYAVAVTPTVVGALAASLQGKGRLSIDEIRAELERAY